MVTVTQQRITPSMDHGPFSNTEGFFSLIVRLYTVKLLKLQSRLCTMYMYEPLKDHTCGVYKKIFVSSHIQSKLLKVEILKAK